MTGVGRDCKCQNHARFSCAITCQPEQVNYKVKHVVLVLIHTTLRSPFRSCKQAISDKYGSFRYLRSPFRSVPVRFGPFQSVSVRLGRTNERIGDKHGPFRSVSVRSGRIN